jgi:Fe2+ or Zn2+ uptake regulation protein
LALLLRQENVVTLEEIYETLKEETKEAISDALHRLVTNGTLKKRTLSDGNVLIEVYWTSLTEVWNLSKQPYWEHW